MSSFDCSEIKKRTRARSKLIANEFPIHSNAFRHQTKPLAAVKPAKRHIYNFVDGMFAV